MCYNIAKLNNNTPRCNQCGSELILLKQVTEQLEGSRFPQTTTTYRCSNDSCQAKQDKETTKRLQLKKDKEEAEQKRLEQKQKEKELLISTMDKDSS